MWSLWEQITDEHVARVVAGELAYADMHVRRTQAFLAEIGISGSATDIAAFEQRRTHMLRRSWRLFDDVLPCLEWLTAAGVRIAAVTNASGAHQRDKLASLGLTPFFDHIAIAGELGFAKPDPVMFHTVCFALGCEPTEAVHVGDKLTTDAVGARDAGLAAVWLNRDGHAGTGSSEPPAGIHVLTSLRDLPELLVSEFARLGVPAQR